MRKRKKKAIVTIEAAFGIPIFVFAVVCLIWLIEMQNIKISIRQASYAAAKSATEDTAIVPILNTVKLKTDIISFIGEERLENSILEGAGESISCWKSYISPFNGEMNITVEYKMLLPITFFGTPTIKAKEEIRMHSWNGHQISESEGDKKIVYITEHQAVYHEDYQCTYLQLKIRFVPYGELNEIRNEDGSIYYACDKCVYGEALTGVYITENGSKYHNSLECSGLKRTIRAVNKSDVPWLGGCSRCSQ